MCDYSLEAYSSRRAVAGEDLTLRRFPSSSLGFMSADNGILHPWSECVVCCEPGMTMTLHLDEGPVDVTFATREDALGSPIMHFHRDGVTMPDGTFKSLQQFSPGLKATVIKPLPEAIVEAAAGAVAFEPEVRVADVGAPLVEAEARPIWLEPETVLFPVVEGSGALALRGSGTGV